MKVRLYIRKGHVQALPGSFEIADLSKPEESPHSVAELP